MAKTTESTLAARLAKAARVRSDRERNLYVTARKLSTPLRTWSRTRLAAERAPAAEFTIPDDTGIAILPSDQLPEAREIAELAQAELATVDAAVLGGNKDFLQPMLDQGALDRESPLVRFALRQDVVDAVTAYLGVVPVLNSLQLYYSGGGSRGEFVSSQLFHCDGDDTRQIKVFVLGTEVGPDNGPLMVMDAATSERLRSKVDYQYRNRVEDAQVKEQLGDVELTAVVGAPGTPAFVDTSRCFHYGSRVGPDAAPRVVAILQYLTPYSFMLPRNYRAEAPFRRLVRPDSSRLERLVLGVD